MTTHEVSVLLAAAACQISCQSDTDLNFAHIWLEMHIQAPKIGVLGDLYKILTNKYDSRVNFYLEKQQDSVTRGHSL